MLETEEQSSVYSDGRSDRISGSLRKIKGTILSAGADQLKTKLSTIPKDGRVVWKYFSQDPDAEAKLFQELKTFLAERGMTLDRAEEKKETNP